MHTPRAQVFPIQGVTSAVCDNVEPPLSPYGPPFSPKSATKMLAESVILEKLHVLNKCIDPDGKVLYGNQISSYYEKPVIPPVPADLPPCPITMVNYGDDNEVTRMLEIWFNVVPADTLSKYVRFAFCFYV